MEKLAIARQFERILAKRVEQGRIAVECSAKTARSLPPCKLSDPDTQKEDASNYNLGLQLNLAEVIQGHRNLVDLIDSLEKDPGDFVQVGSLVHLSLLNKKGNDKFYFIIPNLGGERIHFGNDEITSVSAVAPLGKAIIGKTEGEEINFNQVLFEIKRIY